jgi:hypothetical protein
MSAYIVSPKTIQIIATAAAAIAPEQLSGADAYRAMVDDLCAQNVASIVYRYGHEADAEIEAFTGMHPKFWRTRAAQRLPETPTAAAVFDACREYDYQSCEHPQYADSTAGRLIAALKARSEHYAAEEAEQARRAACATADAIRAQAIALGKNWLAANRPVWAKAFIVAQLMQDDSDSQTDYYASHASRSRFLAWSKHTRDLFSEMRKAADRFPETHHLGVGKGCFTAYVEIGVTFQSNGSYYHQGSKSHWHSEMLPSAPFTTRTAAEAFISAAGEPGNTVFEGQVIPFAWRIAEQEIEHREKWSMGSGYYLGGKYSGWRVSKSPLTDYRIDELAVIIGRQLLNDGAIA